MGVVSLLGAVEFTARPDEERMLNRSLIIFREARKRGIRIEVMVMFGKITNEFRYQYRGRTYYYEAIPLVDGRNTDIDHKGLVKDLYLKNSIPVAPGACFISKHRAYNFGKSLGYPLVVKPATGTLGYHVVYPVGRDAELADAIRIVWQFKPEIIVEKFIAGKNYRATVIGDQVFVVEKELPNVVGDGVSTIGELVYKKNKHPDRKAAGTRSATIFKILIPPDVDLQKVLPAGEKIYFNDKFLPGIGSDAINKTAELHLKNREMFLRAAALLHTELVGFDVIAEDISRPCDEQTFAILEANGVPYIDMHAVPTHGVADPVAEAVWDTVLAKHH